MKRQHWIIGGAILASQALLPAATHAATTHKPAGAASAASLGLRQADVQRVYGASFHPFIHNAYSASKRKECGANYTSGYLATYGNFAHAAKGVSAVVSVMSTVFIFRNSSDPACAFNIFKKNGPALYKGAHISPISGVGDAAYQMIVNQPKQHAYAVIINFYRGRYQVSITVSGIGGVPRRADYLRLAAVVDHRLQSA